MEENQYNSDRQFNEEEESGFDIMEWLLLFLHYWYLFVIFIGLALGVAYLKNRSWIASYRTVSTLMIEESSRYSSGSQVLMQGFGVQSGFRNLDNQIYILKSYDFISRVVDSLPSFNIDYISQGRFKIRNRYSDSPIAIKADYISPNAYGILFKVHVNEDESFVITDDNKLGINIKGRLNQPLQNNLFFLTIFPTQKTNQKYDMYFVFRSKESLTSEFLSKLDVNYLSDGASVLATSLISETPQRDIDFLDKLSEIFLAENLERKNDAANKTMQFIDEQLGDVKKSLEASEGAMTEFRQSNQIMDMSSHSSEILGKATRYDEKQNEFRLKETYFNYLTNYINTGISSGSAVVPSSLGVNEPMLMTLVQQFNETLRLRDEITEKNPLYSKYNREIENIKNSIKEVVKNVRATMALEKNDLDKKFSTVKKEITVLPQKEMEMIGLERKYRIDDNYYTFFLQKRAEAAIQKASNSPDNNVLDMAREIGITNGDVKSKTYMIFGAIGFLIPLLILVLSELLNNTIRSAKDVEKNSSFSLIGAIRHTQNKDPLLAAHRPRSSFTEMFRVIRTRLEFIVQRKNNIAILVTSTESGDGKTYFCTNLASVYGMSGAKTILVDMDIRKPSIQERLSMIEK
ncbi:MAG: GumC family protein, partial [Paludibacteraceae bacterium]